MGGEQFAKVTEEGLGTSAPSVGSDFVFPEFDQFTLTFRPEKLPGNVYINFTMLLVVTRMAAWCMPGRDGTLFNASHFKCGGLQVWGLLLEYNESQKNVTSTMSCSVHYFVK